MRLSEIMRHKMDDERLKNMGGQGTPAQHHEHVLKQPNSFQPVAEFPAPGGLTVRKHGTKIFVMRGDEPLVSMTYWGDPKGTLIGPIANLIVADQARGQGLGKLLYRILLDNGFTIKSGDNHTQHSEKLWDWLASQPDIEVTAHSRDKTAPVGIKDGRMSSEIDIYGPDAWARLTARKR